MLTVRRHGRLAGVLPLLRRGPALAAMANDHTPVFELLADADDAAQRLAVALFRLRPQRLELDYLDASGGSVEAVRRAAASSGYRLAERPWEQPPYVELSLVHGGVVQPLDAKVRRDLARRRRRLEEQGAVALDVQDGRERLEALLEEGFALESSGWKATRGTAILSRPETRAFYAGLARWAAGRDTLRLAFLRVDGRAVAFQLGLEEGGRYYFVKGGYDPASAAFAPARLLTQAMIARAVDRGLSRFEFLGPAEPFKLEWTSACYDLRRLQAFAPGPAGLARWTSIVYGRPAARAVVRSVRRR